MMVSSRLAAEVRRELLGVAKKVKS